MIECGIHNVKIVNVFTDIEAMNYVNAVYHDMVNVENMDKPLYFKIADELSREMEKGWGVIPSSEVNPDEYDVYFGMIESLYIFSAAKQYQLIRELILCKETEVGFSEYNKKATDIFKKYNTTYFSAELDMANIQGESARKWLDNIKWNNA